MRNRSIIYIVLLAVCMSSCAGPAQRPQTMPTTHEPGMDTNVENWSEGDQRTIGDDTNLCLIRIERLSNSGHNECRDICDLCNVNADQCDEDRDLVRCAGTEPDGQDYRFIGAIEGGPHNRWRIRLWVACATADARNAVKEHWLVRILRIENRLGPG